MKVSERWHVSDLEPEVEFRCQWRCFKFRFGVYSGHQVEAVNRFTYLGSDVDSSGYCIPEILRRIGLASSIMSQLGRVWRQSRLSNTT